MQNNARIGGVLSIVGGSLGLCGFLIGLFFVVLIAWGVGDFSYTYDSGTDGEFVAIFIMVFYIVIFVFYALICTLAIVGGAFALRRKHWGWALAGSIGATLVFLPCGIPAIIFTALAKPEFQVLSPPAPPAPVEPIAG
jgi:heme/copper-type cytochrome/quinol oxidase subunit 2